MSTHKIKKCGPISKSLLTPCRRPGLSRKVKTPLHPASRYQPLDIVKTVPDNKLDHIKPVPNNPDIATEVKDFSQNLKTYSRTHENSSKEIKKTVETDTVGGIRSNTIVNNEEKTLQSIKDIDKLNSKKKRVSSSNDISDKEMSTLLSQKHEHKFSPEKLEASPRYRPLNIVKIECDNKLDHIKPVSNNPEIATEVKSDSRIHENSFKEIKKNVENDEVRGIRSNTTVNNEEKTLQSIKDKDKLDSKKEGVSNSNDIVDKKTVILSSQKGEHKFSPEKLENVIHNGILKDVNWELNHNVESELKVIVERCHEKVNSNELVGCKSKSIEKKDVKSKKFRNRLSLKRSMSNSDSVSDLEGYPSPIKSASKAKKLRIDVEDIVDMKQDTITDIPHKN